MYACAATWQRRKIYILFSAKTAKSGSTKPFNSTPAAAAAAADTQFNTALPHSYKIQCKVSKCNLIQNKMRCNANFFFNSTQRLLPLLLNGPHFISISIVGYLPSLKEHWFLWLIPPAALDFCCWTYFDSEKSSKQYFLTFEADPASPPDSPNYWKNSVQA